MVTAAGGGANSYSYNADGKRVRRVVGAQTFFQVYGIGGELVGEYLWNGSSATLQKEYGYRGGEMLVVAEGATVRWLVTDHLGTPRILTDQAGTLAGVTRHDYFPFGEENLQGAQRSGNGYQADNVRQKFTEYERDVETNLDFAEARYYSNLQARFTSYDPLVSSAERQTPQSWNRYSYVINNPMKYIDPTGLAWIVGPGDGTFWDPDITNEKDLRKKYGKGFRIISGQTRFITSSNNPGFIKGHAYTFNSDGTVTDHGVYVPPPPPVVLPDHRYGDQMALALVSLYGKAALIALTGGSASLPAAITGAGEMASDFFLDEDDPDPLTAVMGINTLVPGPNAQESIPSSDPYSVTPAEQKAVNDLGNKYGCHTCGATSPGTKSGNWIGDHQPSTKLNSEGKPQNLYPHCLSCSRRQGGAVRAILSKLLKLKKKL